MNTNPEEEEEIAADSIYNIEELEPLDDPLALDDEYDGQTFENSGSAYGSTNTTLSELDSSDDGRIILVDVNSLKSAFTLADSYAGNVPASTSISSSTTTPKAYRERDMGQASTSSGATSYASIELPLDDEINEEGEGTRSDGSDSGLGLEICSNLLADTASTSTSGKWNLALSRRFALIALCQLEFLSIFLIIFSSIRKHTHKQLQNLRPKVISNGGPTKVMRSTPSKQKGPNETFNSPTLRYSISREYKDLPVYRRMVAVHWAWHPPIVINGSSR